MHENVHTFLVYCCQQPNTIYATDVAGWDAARELEADGDVRLEWLGPRSTMVWPTDQGRYKAQLPYNYVMSPEESQAFRATAEENAREQGPNA